MTLVSQTCSAASSSWRAVLGVPLDERPHQQAEHDAVGEQDEQRQADGERSRPAGLPGHAQRVDHQQRHEQQQLQHRQQQARSEQQLLGQGGLQGDGHQDRDDRREPGLAAPLVAHRPGHRSSPQSRAPVMRAKLS